MRLYVYMRFLADGDGIAHLQKIAQHVTVKAQNIYIYIYIYIY